MSHGMMRVAAIERFGDPEQLSIQKVPLPDPGPGQVRMRIAAAAVNPADLGMVTGVYRWKEEVSFPLVPGYDAAGSVDALGEGVSSFQVGDQVIACSQHSLTQVGTYAEYAILSEHYLAPAPQGIELIAAASLPLAGLTALQALEQLQLAPGQTLLINGPLGAVGGFALQLVALRGIQVLAPTFAHEAELARTLGATFMLDREQDIPAQVKQAVPSGVDAALDVIGGVAARSAFEAVHDGGLYVTVVPEFWVPGGQFVPQRGITPRVVGVRSNTLQLIELSSLLANGQLTTRVAKVFSLEHASTAHRLLAAGSIHGKIILLP
ncbi:NADP-dependent oxidoreductase [Ktedonosporobacter rubrisoli]|uniref:NADP-dependent oxidoreductase n=1 Tax=Ktedonosporobacter rubrisoli TaxID=2509675 RepID=A0A4P6JND6_KTERU|nr:NADP-dependent oxidoreductase [Ktedonosporobacter rubrisoli]QBD76610.1 NADP-dependent oxidoreductase [Ktedonosporobacter rubrisoli]